MAEAGRRYQASEVGKQPIVGGKKPIGRNDHAGVTHQISFMQTSTNMATPRNGWASPKTVAYKNLGFMKWLDEDDAILLTGAPDAVFHGKDQLDWYLGGYKTA